MAVSGREVLTIKATVDYPRNTEGAMTVLNDGTIMYAYSRFHESSGDNSSAEIYAVFSKDDGETWENGRTIISKKPDDINIMSVSFLRMLDGSLGIFFIKKTGEGKQMNCTPYMSRSYDEGITWEEPIRCIDKNGYFVVNNDRVIRLKSGRVIIPSSYHHELSDKGLSCFFISDDDCKTFHESKMRLDLPFNSHNGMQETGVAQLKDGRLWAWARTSHGHQFEAFSDDEGETWGDVCPNPFFTSPLSPMGVKWLNNGNMLAVFNPIPVFNGRYSHPDAKSPHATSVNIRKCDMYHPFATYGGRTPLTCAVSENGSGVFMPRLLNLEDNPDLSFCYPAILSNKDYVLIAYFYGYMQDGKPYYNSRIKKLYLNELF